MDIERINENTLKLAISYNDIEERGFTKDEIWYNRDKGEELFWVMMDELNDDQFEINGPLWIQVVAKEVGLELTVTVVSNPGDFFNEAPFDASNKDGQFGNLFDHESIADMKAEFAEEEAVLLEEIVFELAQFDDMIPLAASISESFDAINELYVMDDQYYLYIDLRSLSDIDQQQDYLSPIREFSTPSKKTIHLLQEYGKVIMEVDSFKLTREFF
ncbi:adaptor protein MecA [Kurthia sibirica]|uniref:Adaptor protein n=1 Tax=Kurthia sibirica TaxID=202750 RepID=A0A2U3AMS6_9BACL|nr:adaptor protein MecA [Kurthia sibirica]PWI25850.1 adaptor protein [Kurthia sibirica]GEK34286.1 adapter protein MecA 1 [Kurthia sibirica]